MKLNAVPLERLEDLPFSRTCRRWSWPASLGGAPLRKGMVAPGENGADGCLGLGAVGAAQSLRHAPGLRHYRALHNRHPHQLADRPTSAVASTATHAASFVLAYEPS